MSRRQNSLLVSPLPVEKKTKSTTAVVVEEDADVLIANAQGSDEDESHDTVFKTKCKTKEETANAEEGYSTMMMIVFAVILVVLVCLIVWMVVSTNESKKNEDELKSKLTFHPPHMPSHMQPNFQVPPHMQHMHNMQMQQMHMLQSQANLNPKVPNTKLRVEEVEETNKKENVTVESKPAIKESKNNEDEEITADYLKELSKKTDAMIKDGTLKKEGNNDSKKEGNSEVKKEGNGETNLKPTAEWNKEDKSADEKMKRIVEEESEDLLNDDY